MRRIFSVLAIFALLAAPAAARTLRTGDRGQAVRTVQQRLGIAADGVYGTATARAVRRFQRAHGLRITGRVDAATRRALFPPVDNGTGGAAPASTTSSLDDAARAALGRPYEAGASGPDAFDCSGLVVWAGHAVGLDLPRSSFSQYKLGTAVARDAIAAGDLVFFDTNGPGASDVGIATGPDTAISATTHGVREHPILGPYWGDHFVGARRIS